MKRTYYLEGLLGLLSLLGFVAGMLVMAAAVLGTLLLGRTSPEEALLTGCAAGWAASVVVYALTAAWYGFRENWGLARD